MHKIHVVSLNPHFISHIKNNMANKYHISFQMDYIRSNQKFDVLIVDTRDQSLAKALMRKLPGDKILIATPPCTSEQLMKFYQVGADAHVFTPLHIPKLSMALENLLRPGDRNQIKVGKLVIDTYREKVWVQDRELTITRRQYEILGVLAYHYGAPVRREYLNMRTCDRRRCSDKNSVDVHISSLRRKLRKAGIQKLIETVYGIGYRLNV